MNLEVELIAGVVKGKLPPPHLPAPRLIKIFISGERDEFPEERKQLLEVVGPELQSIYDDMGIEVLLVDMQYGTEKHPDKNPQLANFFLEEITASHKYSRGCFFLLLLGANYSTGWVPTKIEEQSFIALLKHCSLLNEYYEFNGQSYVLKTSSEETAKEEWQNNHESNLRQILKIAAESAIFEQPNNQEIRNIISSTVERQFDHGLNLDPDGKGILTVIREWTGEQTPNILPEAASLQERVNKCLPSENVISLKVDYRPEGVDPSSDCHEAYLRKLRNSVLERLQTLVNASIESDPEIKSRKKMVQEVYAENLAHLSLLREVKPINPDDDVVNRIKRLLLEGKTEEHGPIVIHGPKSTGKSAIIARVYESCSEWLQASTLKVVRLCTSTPRSAYSLELLRIMCEHIGFLSGNNDGNLPRDASFDPLYLNNWFNEIMRGIEENPLSEQLIILIDDLHRLHPLECDIVAALSWLPISLPAGVHLVATTALPPEALRLTPLQVQKIRTREILIELPEERSNHPNIDSVLNGFESLVGIKAANRLGSLLASFEYGLTETEILELIMPTGDDAPLKLSAGQYNFATWCLVRRNLAEWLRVRVMSGRLMFSWRWSIREVARKRYLTNQDILKSCHAEVANLFFTVDDQASEERSPVDPDMPPPKETPFQSAPQSQDITYTLRHVEEAWLHLLQVGDVEQLKKLAVCAFDFLLAAVQMVSVSYLRCVLEHSRRYLLERDLELVYYAVRKSSDVLTRNPLQLGAQLICWLRPVAEDGGDLVSRMVMAAMAWCDGYTAPLLVPLNGWLQPPLPLQIRALSCPQGVTLVETAPSGQHVVVIPPKGDAQLWHVMSGQLVHIFKGHSSPISCLAVTQQSQYLLTGSEDTSIIVWDMKELSLKRKICEHIAPVLTLTLALNNSVIVSGGEDSRIIATKLLTGEVLMKVDHHRGPVTATRVDSAGEILVSGSADCTVCLWSLESFSLLNSITLPSPIAMLDISIDSVFLLAACEDQKLYLRSLATGSEIHKLRGHQGAVKSLCLAKDCRRAIVGGVEGRVSVFDIHSGRLTRTLPANHSADVTCVKVTEKDDFLITAGGGRVTYWSFRSEEASSRQSKSSKCQESLQPHTAPISCIDISRDGAMAVTGGVDSLVNLWQINTHELLNTLEGHIASVTCIAFSASGLFIASGSEDKTVRVWGLTLGLLVATFRHQAPVTAVTAMLDGGRVVSSDRAGAIRVWAADTGTLIQSVCGPGRCFAVASDMRYAVCGTGDNHVRIISLGAGPEEKYQVTHSQDITCLVVTPDSQSLITGSRDMSLKVWQLAGGKLSQVLVGHTDHVTCVAVAVLDKSIVVSGSRDANLIVWDINTGADLHTLSAHLGYVTCVRLSGDGTLAVSGSEDKSLIVWDTKKGTALNSIMLHVPVLNVEMSTDCSRIALHLLEHKCMPILCLHNTPAQYVKLPSYVAPRDLRPPGPKRPARRLLKKEVSLDTYTWQRKYGHLTSGFMVEAVEERLKRRFSVSASMEEISKAGLAGSQPGLGAEQAALAQSQHFDQLQAIWNKQSPPPKPKGLGRTLSKQSSLQATRISDSEEEDHPE